MSKIAHFTNGQLLVHNNDGEYTLCKFQSEIDHFKCQVTLVNQSNISAIVYYQDLQDLEAYKRNKRLDIYRDMQRLQKKLIGMDNGGVDELFN